MRKILIFALLVSFYAGCAKKAPDPEPVVIAPIIEEKINFFPFMSKMINQYQLKESDLFNLQFYISSDIVLKKESKMLNSKISDGALVIQNGTRSNEIIIKAKTPCSLVKLDENSIQVRFEDENYKLTFINSTQDDIDKYYLSAYTWRSEKGIVKTNNTLYEAIETSGQSYLMINLKNSNEANTHKEILEGHSLKKIRNADTKTKTNKI